MKDSAQLQIRSGLLTIFVPVFNEEESLPDLFEDLVVLNDAVTKLQGSIEVLFHDNCSSDSSWGLIMKFSKSVEFKVSAKKFAKNIGYQPSLAISFSNASGDAFVVYQSDRQDPIEVIIEMYVKWRNGDNCIVAVANSRAENIKDKIGRIGFVKLMRSASDLRIEKWFTDFYLLDKSLYSQLSGLPAVNQFIRGLIVQHFTIDSYVIYHRRSRPAGTSNFNFARKYTLAIDGLLLHGTRVIRRITLTSFSFSFVFTVIGIPVGMISWIQSPSNRLIVLGILLSTFLLSICIGMLGIVLEYLIRIHQRLHSPTWLIESNSKIYICEYSNTEKREVK